MDFELLNPALAMYKPLESGGLISVLQEAQDLYGHLSENLIEFIASEMDIPVAKVYGVVTFYAQFRTQPVGKHCIMVCQGTACHVTGSRRVEEAITELLDIKEDETTSDGQFTLQNVACLGCCSLAPAMMIGNETYGKLTPPSAKDVIESLK